MLNKMYNIIDSIRVSVKKLLRNPLKSMDPGKIADIVAVYHLGALLVFFGCAVAALVAPSQIGVILNVVGANLFIAYLLILVHGGCPITNIENQYRKKAHKEQIHFNLKYVYNLILRLVQKLK